MTRGMIVFSKAGRDKGSAMVVLNFDGETCLLADGKKRTITNPKKKKLKHIQPTKYLINLQPVCGRALQDADVRKQISEQLDLQEVEVSGKRRCN